MASSKGGAKKFYHTTSQQAYYMRPSEAKVVSLEGARPVDDAQKVRRPGTSAPPSTGSGSGRG